jgi:fluoroacetyl-CoA thioesterase
MTNSNAAAGRSAAHRYRIEERHSAASVGSGDVPVLATPTLLAWMEAATCDALVGCLDKNQTSVGWKIHITHEQPSRVGSVIEVEAQITSIDGQRVHFTVEARDESGRRVGHAEIARVIVDRERFATSP